MSNIRLPDLNTTDTQIVPENIRATQAIYLSAMLEELKIFQVADHLVAKFQNGLLPVKKNSARGLYHFWRETPQRLTTRERRNLYARVLGASGGDDGVATNRDFNDLWARFIHSVSELSRQSQTDLEAQATAQENARAAGRELAKNLSMHGHGVAFFAAKELQEQIDQMVKLLSDREVQQAAGSRDVWQLVDQTASLELGGEANPARFRTMASSGSTIIAWLAKNARRFSISSSGALLKLRKSGARADKNAEFFGSKSPTDADLLAACEQWLAVSGTADGSVNDHSQPNQ